MNVSKTEVCVAAATGAVFGVIGYVATRHVWHVLGRVGVK